MPKKEISAGAVPTFARRLRTGRHKVPTDLRKALASYPTMSAVWNDITPLARNEWICWVTSAKKPETRIIRLEKMRSKIAQGMRRPCCWAGCIHRGSKLERRLYMPFEK